MRGYIRRCGCGEDPVRLRVVRRCLHMQSGVTHYVQLKRITPLLTRSIVIWHVRRVRLHPRWPFAFPTNKCHYYIDRLQASKSRSDLRNSTVRTSYYISDTSTTRRHQQTCLSTTHIMRLLKMMLLGETTLTSMMLRHGSTTPENAHAR